jgi:transposase
MGTPTHNCCKIEKTAIQALDPLDPVLPLSPGRAERLDNLSAHKTQAGREFLRQHSRVRFHFTPTYSSWLNQVEIWFAKIKREVIARGIFTSVSDLARKFRRYINGYSANARPIQWKYSDPNAPDTTLLRGLLYSTVKLAVVIVTAFGCAVVVP